MWISDPYSDFPGTSTNRFKVRQCHSRAHNKVIATDGKQSVRRVFNNAIQQRIGIRITGTECGYNGTTRQIFITLYSLVSPCIRFLINSGIRNYNCCSIGSPERIFDSVGNYVAATECGIRCINQSVITLNYNTTLRRDSRNNIDDIQVNIKIIKDRVNHCCHTRAYRDISIIHRYRCIVYRYNIHFRISNTTKITKIIVKRIYQLKTNPANTIRRMLTGVRVLNRFNNLLGLRKRDACTRTGNFNTVVVAAYVHGNTGNINSTRTGCSTKGFTQNSDLFLVTICKA